MCFNLGLGSKQIIVLVLKVFSLQKQFHHWSFSKKNPDKILCLLSNVSAI